MARAAFESAEQFGGNRRPFVLSRSGFAGIQRYEKAKATYLPAGAWYDLFTDERLDGGQRRRAQRVCLLRR
jgi:alpha-glucosidase (family GH31 glycosyl hydrolase)